MGSPADFFEYARSLYDTKHLTNFGPLVSRLERRLAEFHQVEHCVTYCNACTAILAMLEVAKQMRPGMQVIIPALTYEGLPHIVQWAGLKPLFCDIQESTHTLEPALVEKSITPDVVAILAVHQVNSTSSPREMESIASRHGVPLFFDAVHGVNCTSEGRKTGGFGLAEAFSLHATKLINGFEGGYVTTNDSALAVKLTRMSSFGFYGKDTVRCLGLNGKLNELHAAMALASLDQIDRITEGNRQRYEWYLELFNKIDGCRIFPYLPGESYNYGFILLALEPDWLLTRRQIVDILKHEGTQAKEYYFPPLHLSEHMPADMEVPNLPVTEKVAGQFISMPTGEFVDRETIEGLAQLTSFLRQNDDLIARRLG